MSTLTLENQPLNAVIMLTTLPDPEICEALARSLIEAGVAACVNCLPAGTSVFKWDGQVQTQAETVVLIKTTRESAAKVSRIVHNAHPYELPELLVVPVIGGSTQYLDWLTRAARPAS